jgi:hypothetical protein
VRSRLILLTGAAFLAAVHVLGVLLGSPIWPLALAGALLALAAAGRPPRWLAPVALAPLILQAALTVPRVHTGDYGWFVTTFSAEPAPSAALLDALDTSFRLAGAPFLFAAILLIALKADKSDKSGAMSEGAARGEVGGNPAPGEADESVAPRWVSGIAVAVMLLAGLAVLAYAATRVVALGSLDPVSGAAALVAAVFVPVVFALTSAALAAVISRRGRWPGVLGAFLLVVSALPMIDSALDALPTSYQVYGGSDPTRLFGWDFLTPSDALPGLVQALTVGVQLTGLLLLIGSKTIKPYGG